MKGGCGRARGRLELIHSTSIAKKLVGLAILMALTVFTGTVVSLVNFDVGY
jgi:hypothetical protein